MFSNDLKYSSRRILNSFLIVQLFPLFIASLFSQMTPNLEYQISKETSYNKTKTNVNFETGLSKQRDDCTEHKTHRLEG